MDKIVKQLKQQRKELKKAILYAEKQLVHAPEGILSIQKNKNTNQYILRENKKDTHGKYIKKRNITLIRSLAQKDYAQKLLVAANSGCKKIEIFLSKYSENVIQDVYRKLALPKQQLVTPFIMTDEAYVAQWEQTKYQGKADLLVHDYGIYTEKGEPVRSKSEKILADKFLLKGIPYHYEKSLHLSGYGTVYPDFTVLNKWNRKEYYWEHLGLMDQKEYCEKAIQKIETMIKNGIFQGENLILTYETAGRPLDMRITDRLIEKYLLVVD